MINDLLSSQLAFVTGFLDIKVIFFGTLFALAALLVAKKYYIKGLLLLTTSTSYIYSLLMKDIFKQPRPATADITQMSGPDIYSFPSSHVVIYTVFWGYIIYLTFVAKRLNSSFRNFLRVLAIYFLVLVGASRIWFGFHRLSDVIGGYIFGGLFLCAVIFIDTALVKYSSYSFPKNKDKNRK